jgi:hypothetical protein
MAFFILPAAAAPAGFIPARPHSRHAFVLTEQSSQLFDDTHCTCPAFLKICSTPAVHKKLRAVTGVSTSSRLFMKPDKRRIVSIVFFYHCSKIIPPLLAGDYRILLIDGRGQRTRERISNRDRRGITEETRCTMQPDRDIGSQTEVKQFSLTMSYSYRKISVAEHKRKQQKDTIRCVNNR